VDPSDNVFDNPYTREKHKRFIEEYESPAPFDLATLRMVAEHVTDPDAVVAALARLVKPGGRAVIFTVDLWSPITAVSRLVPFDLHYPVKKFLWGGEERTRSRPRTG
jgi:2-polyprenyl-3-methyl-5-hydroxy-6-metoxy-1,4-benzoquinol methylase